MGRHDVIACVLGPPRQWCPMACTVGSIILRKAVVHCGYCPRALHNFWRGYWCSLAGGMGVRGENVSRRDTPNVYFGRSRAARAVQTHNKNARVHPVCSPYLIYSKCRPCCVGSLHWSGSGLEHCSHGVFVRRKRNRITPVCNPDSIMDVIADCFHCPRLL